MGPARSAILGDVLVPADGSVVDSAYVPPVPVSGDIGGGEVGMREGGNDIFLMVHSHVASLERKNKRKKEKTNKKREEEGPHGRFSSCVVLDRKSVV